jgi:hypothetical protein
MHLGRYVVLSQGVRGFDELAMATEHAKTSLPSVICERMVRDDGTTGLVEILRHDCLYDEERREWRVKLG